MQPDLKDLTTADDEPLDEIIFVEGEDFELSLLASIGPQGDGGADLFYLTALSPSKVESLTKDGPRLFRHYLVMKSFNATTVREVIESLCHRTNAANWHEVAGKLARYMAWEFEDYQQRKPSE
jgi:hypothetical protein